MAAPFPGFQTSEWRGPELIARTATGKGGQSSPPSRRRSTEKKATLLKCFQRSLECNSLSLVWLKNRATQEQNSMKCDNNGRFDVMLRSIPNKKFNGPIPAYFPHDTIQKYIKRALMVCLDWNTGKQDGRRRRIHRAMASPLILQRKISAIIESSFYKWFVFPKIRGIIISLTSTKRIYS